MKCCFCNEESDILMIDGRCICLHCAAQKGLVTCAELGKIVADPEFHCDNICSDCIYGEGETK